MEDKKTCLDIGELNELYTKADSADASLFSEMKSNVLLVNSEHYRHLDRRLTDRTQGNDSISDRQKIRITKNHTQRIVGRIKNGIAGLTPNLKAFPHNESEQQDKKNAELNNSVLTYGKERYDLDELKEDWIEDFVDMGEVACKIYWDAGIGDVVGYKQAIDENNNPIFIDPVGNPTVESQTIKQSLDPMTGLPTQEVVPHKEAPDEEAPVYGGDFVFETILPFNLLRDPASETMKASPYIIIRKMMEVPKIKALVEAAFSGDELDEKLKHIKADSETTYRVFDTNKGHYEDGKGKVMLREYYFRPCAKYPKGYFVISTQSGILFEGKLPFGIFPIAWRGNKKIQTSPRGRSPIKVLRPLQYEANRLSSKIVENQLINGDDKIITPPGAKMSQGALLPGVRNFTASGQPVVIPGRTGDQYLPHYDKIIEEMYQIVDEMVDDDGQSAQLDVHQLMYRGIQRKQKYGRPAKEFQYFLKEVYWIYLELAKKYFDENRYIRAVGRNEAINIQEFRSADPLSVSIKLEEQTDDSESVLGKSISLQNVLQYIGKDLPKEAIAKVVMNLPYANGEAIFSDLLLTQKNIENDLLALDRGEQVQAGQDDEHHLYIQQITNRMKAPDFKQLSPQIQQNYSQVRDQHRSMEADQQKQLLMAEQQAIPMDGNLVKCDVYVQVGDKQQRMTIPENSLEWLKDKLDMQGMSQQRLGVMGHADQVAVAQQAIQAAHQPQQNQMAPMTAPQQAPQVPQGVMNGNGSPIKQR